GRRGARGAGRPGRRAVLRARGHLLTVQALGRGSRDIGALEGPRAGRAAAVALEDEPVRIPIEDALDLHAFAPRDVASVVAEYLDAAQARGFTELRIIAGRGIRVQRKIVQAAL